MGQHDLRGFMGDNREAVGDYEQNIDEAIHPVETGEPMDFPAVPSAGVAVWAAVGKALVGLVGMVVVLACGEDMAEFMQRWGYVPVMLVYMLAMMLTGGLVAAGAMGLWSVVRGDK